jgi:hypothetical protein
MELAASPALAQPPVQNETQSVKMGVAFVVAMMVRCHDVGNITTQ